jgi:cell shape-determining protein MreC
MPLSANVNEVGPERVARALRKMAEDLVTERRRVAVLQRENRELRAQLEELQRVAAAEREPASGATHK